MAYIHTPDGRFFDPSGIRTVDPREWRHATSDEIVRHHAENGLRYMEFWREPEKERPLRRFDRFLSWLISQLRRLQR